MEKKSKYANDMSVFTQDTREMSVNMTF